MEQQTAPLRALGCDIGRSGKTAFSCVEETGVGNSWTLRQCMQTSIVGISAPEVEQHIVRWFSILNPAIVVMEGNGPGGPASDYIILNNPQIPLLVVDTGLPGLDVPIWNNVVLSEKEFANVRAEMYWVVKLLLKERRLKFAYEDAELFGQLSSLPWELDKTKGERIKIASKRGLKLNYYHSELEGNPGSRSPDKADALALSCFGYAMVVGQTVGKKDDDDGIYMPDQDGFFPIGHVDLIEELA